MRLLKNNFAESVWAAEAAGADAAALTELLGRARAKKGMFEGDIIEGELEVGQVAGQFDQIMPAAAIVAEIITEFKKEQAALTTINF